MVSARLALNSASLIETRRFSVRAREKLCNHAVAAAELRIDTVVAAGSGDDAHDRLVGDQRCVGTGDGRGGCFQHHLFARRKQVELLCDLVAKNGFRLLLRRALDGDLYR